MTWQEQERMILELRERLKPSPVRIGHVPNWFRLALLKAYGCAFGDTSGAGILHEASIRWRGSWLDHWGSTRLANGEVVFVAEPYDFSPANAAECEQIAVALGCRWYPEANSWWWPGQTKRIVFSQTVGPMPLVAEVA